jgi:hypothetical protein
MRVILFAMVLVACGVADAQDTTVCVGGRCLLPRNRPATVVVDAAPQPAVSVVAPQARRVVVHASSGAQAHADQCAASGRFVHATNFGGGYEGIGWGSSASAATSSCCYWGKRPVREIGTAWCPSRRQWFAVVRYR